MNETDDGHGAEQRPFLSWGDFHWPGVAAGFAISAVVTLAIGVPVWVASDESWVFAGFSMASLFLGGFVAARIAGSSEPLNGAMIVLIHFLLLALAFFVGELTARIPEPLPGLDMSDSTFFFAWPLGQMVLGTVGALVGGVGARGRLGQKEPAGGQMEPEPPGLQSPLGRPSEGNQGDSAESDRRGQEG